MIFLFKRNLFVNSLLLLPYTILLRVKSLLPDFEGIKVSNYGCSSEWLSVIQTIFPTTFLQSLVAIVLIFIQGTLVNRLVNNNRLTKAFTLWPGMFYIGLTSVFEGDLSLSVYTIANTFLLLSLTSLFTIYKKYKPESQLFLTGLWASIAMVFVPSYIIFLAPLIATVLSLRSANVLEFLQVAVGLITTYWLVWVVSYLFDDSDFLTQGLALDFRFDVSHLDYLALGYLGVMIVSIAAIILNNYKFRLRNSLESRKKISTLYILLLTGLIPILLNCYTHSSTLYYFYVPMAIFFTLLTIRFNRLVVAEIIHLVFLAFIFNNHFHFIQF